jgi:hypothetical protein
VAAQGGPDLGGNLADLPSAFVPHKTILVL